MKNAAKIRWVVSILLVFFIVLITNLIDRENFNRLSSSVTTMYEDRIVASDLIFEMSKIIHDKEIAILTSDSTEGRSYHEELTQLTEKYKQTKLTEKEGLLFQQFQEELEGLQQNEAQSASVTNEVLLASIKRMKKLLNELSKVQLQEGKRQVFISDKAKDSINLFTQAEIIFLIIIAVLIQIIILYKPKGIKEG